MIYLTKDQADKVRGRHGKYSELRPVATEDGNFILPMDVLEDPEHKEVLEEFQKCRLAECDIVIAVDNKLLEGHPDREKQVIRILSIKESTIEP